MTTAIPSLRTLTSPLALSPKAIFQVGMGGSVGSQEAGVVPFSHPLHSVARTAGSRALILNRIPAGTIGGPGSPNDVFLGTEDPVTLLQCRHLF